MSSSTPSPKSSAKVTASIQLNLSYLTFKGALKYGSIRQVVTKYRLNSYEMHYEGKLKLSHIVQVIA
jgi:hypothetical protein